MDRRPLLWIVAVIVALIAGWELASAQGEKEKAVQKWEYKILDGGKSATPDGDYGNSLNELGKDGWELVGVEPATRYSMGGGNTSANTRVFHFKRPK
jgi:hypothetical protein